MESPLRLASGMSAKEEINLHICKHLAQDNSYSKINRLPEVATAVRGKHTDTPQGFPQKFISTWIQDAKKKQKNKNRCPCHQGTYSQDQELAAVSGCTGYNWYRPDCSIPASPVPDRYHTPRQVLQKLDLGARNWLKPTTNTKKKNCTYRGDVETRNQLLPLIPLKNVCLP